MSSCSVLVNREYRLPASYIPKNLVEPSIPFDAPAGDPKRLLRKDAAKAVHALFQGAKSCQITLWGVSGYRPYSRQEELYEAALKKANLTVDSPPEELCKLLVAPPGASEHQTGLALDVSCPDVAFDLVEEFAETQAGKWLKAYAPLYGFVIRYPKGKEAVTGYAYEPWHIRYVSKSLALYLSLTGLTLEEYHRI